MTGVAILVHCTSDGAIGFVRVTRTYHMEARGSELAPKLVLATRVSHSQQSICVADDHIITGLSLVEPWNMKVSMDSSLFWVKYQAEINLACCCHSSTWCHSAVD
jgi:hypothetical protein